MRSVLTSQVDQVLAIGGGVTVYRLTNGQSWAQAGSDPGAVIRGAPRVEIHYAEARFYLGVEGAEPRVEVALVACRRQVWDDAVFSRLLRASVRAGEGEGEHGREGVRAAEGVVDLAPWMRGGLLPSPANGLPL